VQYKVSAISFDGGMSSDGMVVAGWDCVEHPEAIADVVALIRAHVQAHREPDGEWRCKCATCELCRVALDKLTGKEKGDTEHA